MNGYLLDTNVLIALLNVRPPEVRLRFEQESDAGIPMCLSSVVEFELTYGVYKSEHREKNREKLQELLRHPFRVIGFGPAEATVAGRIRAELDLRGTPIGAYDVQIAGQALCHDLTLVTANTREFVRVEGLRVVDWSVAL